MALVHKDRVKETSTTTGTGTYTLAGAVTGFQSFSAIGNANTCYYCATDGTDWEVGTGTYTSAGTTLARTAILASSNAGSAVNWAAGTRTIFCDLPASKFRAIGEAVLAADLPAASTSTQGAVQLADQTAQEASTTGRAVTSDVQKFHPSASKAWAKWGVTTTIDASFGVSSITDNGTGDWTVNWSTAFSSANYAVCSNIEVGAGSLFASEILSQATGSVRINVYNIFSGFIADPTKNHVIAFGDQ